MRNRRSIKEANKESLIRSKLESLSNDKVLLDRPAFLDKNSQDELLSPNQFPYGHGEVSSSAKENEFRYKLISDLEVCKNILDRRIDDFFTKHRSFVNAALLANEQFKKIEGDANREILMSLSDDPFSFGFTETFKDYANVDFERSSIEMFREKVMLRSEDYTPVNLQIRNITTNVSVSNGILNDVIEISSTRNILEKDGSTFKIKATTNSPQATVELEVRLELQTETNIDRLAVSAISIENNDNEGISVSYSKDGVEYYNPIESTLERLETQTNIFDIYDTDIKIIKVRFFKYAADRVEDFVNQYIYAIDHIGMIDGSFVSEGTFYSKGIEIFDEEGQPVNFNSAALKTGTCCITPKESSVSFFLSKDGQNYLPANYFGESNDVVEFANQIDTDLFATENADANDLISVSESKWKLNNYIPTEVSVIPGSIKILRNVNAWTRDSFKHRTTIDITNPEGQTFDLGPYNCTIDGTVRSGIVFLEAGTHKVETARYAEVPEKATSESVLRQLDNLYPYNHKYVFEGYSYPRGFTGERLYVGAPSIYETEVEIVSKEYFDSNPTDRAIAYSETTDAGTFFYLHKAGRPQQEEVFIDCRSNDDLIDNKIYIKAILKSNNSSRSPRIDSIQVRVI